MSVGVIANRVVPKPILAVRLVIIFVPHIRAVFAELLGRALPTIPSVSLDDTAPPKQYFQLTLVNQRYGMSRVAGDAAKSKPLINDTAAPS
jgi:hypothetical protein